MTYTTNPNGGVIRDADGAYIPADPLNSDYVAYLAWVTAGNIATPVDLSTAQAAKIAEISQDCQQAIFAGFTSSALGAAYSYPAKTTDQQNLTASVLASLMPGLPANWTTPFWCADANGNWAFVQHTAAQIQQVGQDGKAAILANLSRNQTLAQAVMLCTSAAQVNAINWS